MDPVAPVTVIDKASRKKLTYVCMAGAMHLVASPLPRTFFGKPLHLQPPEVQRLYAQTNGTHLVRDMRAFGYPDERALFKIAASARQRLGNNVILLGQEALRALAAQLGGRTVSPPPKVTGPVWPLPLAGSGSAAQGAPPRSPHGPSEKPTAWHAPMTLP
jgi:hypothetical protein